jgi:cupin fold WbuC family metalloprotein
MGVKWYYNKDTHQHQLQGFEMSVTKSVRYMPSPACEDDVTQALTEMPFGSNGLRRICLHPNAQSPLHIMMIEANDVMEFPAHSHPCDEFMMLIRGEMIVTYLSKNAEKKVELKAGSLLLIPANTIHLVKFLASSTIFYEIKAGPFNENSTIFAKADELN